MISSFHAKTLKRETKNKFLKKVVSRQPSKGVSENRKPGQNIASKAFKATVRGWKSQSYLYLKTTFQVASVFLSLINYQPMSLTKTCSVAYKINENNYKSWLIINQLVYKIYSQYN